MRIGFLLGAGVSLPAGLPSTKDLTRTVLDVDGFKRRSNGTFIELDTNADPFSPRGTKEVKELLGILSGICQRYFADDYIRHPEVNYEDLYYAAVQLGDHIIEEYENPILETVVRRILDSTTMVKESALVSRKALREAAHTTARYIQDAVASGLNWANQSRLDHLGCLVQALQDSRFCGSDVFTLNHDNLIERVLDANKLSYVDGFTATGLGYSAWNADVLEKGGEHLFLKLHGSIDWYSYRQTGLLAKVRNGDPVQLGRSAGLNLGDPSDRPQVLIGTFNKITEYFRRPWFDLMAAFRRQLQQVGLLIASGYSFGDKGVNTCLVEWLGGDDSARLICLHEEGEAQFENARGSILGAWKQFKGKKILIDNQFLADCDWEQLVGRYNLLQG